MELHTKKENIATLEAGSFSLRQCSIEALHTWYDKTSKQHNLEPNAIFFFSHFYFPAYRQAVVTDVVPFPPRFLPSIFIAHRVQQSHCSSTIHPVLLTHALALSPSQFVHKKKSRRIYTSMHSAGLELTKLTYTRLEDNLIRHRGDRSLNKGGCFNVLIPSFLSTLQVNPANINISVNT